MTDHPNRPTPAAPVEGARPTQFEPGHVWRLADGEQFTVLRRSRRDMVIVHCEKDPADREREWFADDIGGAVYVGPAPAASPVREPAKANVVWMRTCSQCGKAFNPQANPDATLCSVECALAAAPVREPPPEPVHFIPGLELYCPEGPPPSATAPCGVKWSASNRCSWTDDRDDVTCPDCLAKMHAAPAAPVREPGELTFAEACAVHRKGRTVEISSRLKDGNWSSWGEWMPRSGDVACSWHVVRDGWSVARYRLKPAPPAPKPGKLEQIVDAWMKEPTREPAGFVTTDDAVVLANAVAREAIACVRRHVEPYVPYGLDAAMDAAAVELLGEGEVKRGG